MSKIVLTICGILAVGLAQISFLSTWPHPVSSLSIALCVVIFIAILIDYQYALWWAFGVGLLFELYSSLAFGITVTSILLTIIVLNLLFNNFFTNRSFYSLLILGYIGTVLYNALIVGSNIVLTILDNSKAVIFTDFGKMFFWQPAFNSIVLVVIFLIYNYTTSKLKSIFVGYNHGL